MRFFVAAVLLAHSLIGFSAEEQSVHVEKNLAKSSLTYNVTPAVREVLPINKGSSSYENEVFVYTSSIPYGRSVSVRCQVILKYDYRTQFSFYVAPRSGEFGSIEQRLYFGKANVSVEEVGSKVYTNHHMFSDTDNKTSVFYINRVKSSNLAIVI
ncbi:MAG: hypothetical protein K0U52_07230, partial [Gammaproteobacteria bacterium]|nr:hypothetical protein [Gammaproteobacteria bacterium]